MKELIHILNQGTEFLVDSREIAKVFKIQPESLRKLIEEHEPELSRLGVLKERISKTTAVLQMSGSSHHDFKENYKSVFYGTTQGNWDDSFFDEEFGGN